MPRWHFPLWQSMVAVAVLAVLLAIIVPVGRVTEYVRLQRQMGTSIRCLNPTNPNVNPDDWDCAHFRTWVAYENVCFDPRLVNTVEMYRLRDDLDRKLKGNVDLDTLVWIWNRLAETGPHGKKYVERFRPIFEQCFPPQAAVPTAPASPPKP